MLSRMTLAVAGGLATAAAPAAPVGGLDPTPLAAEALGLQMSVPVGAVTTTQVTDDGIVYFSTDGGTDPTWSMRISMLSPPAAGAAPTAADLIDTHLETVRATSRQITVITNEPRTIDGARGHLLYLKQTQDDQRPLVRGWLIVPRSARTFLAFSLLITAADYARLRPIFDACFASIKFRSHADLEDERVAQIEKGRAFVGRLTPEHLRSVLGPRQWYRIYRPAGSGRAADDEEVGFLAMHCIEAMRGQLTPQRAASSFGSLEAQRGLMVIIEARAIVNAPSNHYLDVEGRYWMSWDRNQEAWSVLQTQRQGEAARTSAETGVRNLATLDVIHASREEFTRDPSQWTIPDVAYLAQPEIFVLGRLLPREASSAGEMALYCYDSGSRRLTQRIDRWERADDGTGNWVLSTQSMLKPGIVTQIFNARGDRLKRIDGDGTITELIDQNELQRLWRSKGLMAGK